MKSIIKGAVRLVFLATFVSHSAEAQRTDAQIQEMARRVPVVVALSPNFAADSATAGVILRRSDITPHDVIALNEERATADQLEAALVYLSVLRKQLGDTASQSGVYRVPQRAISGGKRRVTTLHASSVLARLRTDTLRAIPRIGTVRARDLYLKPTK
jgi:hypothetical protein